MFLITVRCREAQLLLSHCVKKKYLFQLIHFSFHVFISTTLTEPSIYECAKRKKVFSVSGHSQSWPLIPAVVLSCSSLSTHEAFSHVHISLTLNVQQRVFSVLRHCLMNKDLGGPSVLSELMVDGGSNMPTRNQDCKLTFVMDGPAGH